MGRIEKLNIIIPDDHNRIELIEGIIKFVERRGCNIEVNPHTKVEKVEVIDEEEQVRQILGIPRNA